MPDSVVISSLAPTSSQAHDGFRTTGPLAAQNDGVHLSPLLKLPLELQIKIYRIVLRGYSKFESRRKHDIWLVHRLATQDMDKLGVRDEPPTGSTHHLRTFYDIQESRYRYDCDANYQDRCYDKIRTTYELIKGPVSTEVGLLSVNRRIWQVTVPLFYGDYRITLVLCEGIIPFLEDRGRLARQSIKSLHIDGIFLQTHDEEQTQKLWESNFAYIKQNLTGLQSLYVYVVGKTIGKTIGPEDRLEKGELSMENVHLYSQMSNMRWLVALARLRGLSSFRIGIFLLGLEGHERSSSKKQEAVLQQYLDSKVCQPREEDDDQSLHRVA